MENKDNIKKDVIQYLKNVVSLLEVLCRRWFMYGLISGLGIVESYDSTDIELGMQGFNGLWENKELRKRVIQSNFIDIRHCYDQYKDVFGGDFE